MKNYINDTLEWHCDTPIIPKEIVTHIIQREKNKINKGFNIEILRMLSKGKYFLYTSPAALKELKTALRDVFNFYGVTSLAKEDENVLFQTYYTTKDKDKILSIGLEPFESFKSNSNIEEHPVLDFTDAEKVIRWLKSEYNITNKDLRDADLAKEKRKKEVCELNDKLEKKEERKKKGKDR